MTTGVDGLLAAMPPGRGRVGVIRLAPLLPSGLPDLAAVKTRQQAAWSAGDYAVVGTTLQIVGENLCEALDLRSVLAEEFLDPLGFRWTSYGVDEADLTNSPSSWSLVMTTLLSTPSSLASS